jgi:hypothetical protein
MDGAVGAPLLDAKGNEVPAAGSEAPAAGNETTAA